MKAFYIIILFLLSSSIIHSQTDWYKLGGPVLSGNSGEWDSDIGFGKVISDGGIYKMWYMGGFSTIINLRIGYATSPDGINWTRYGNPVLTPGNSGAFDAGAVGTPSVMRDGSVYKMWYAASTTNPPNQIRIGYATSIDGINWTRENNGNPVLDLGSPGEWDDFWVTQPTVVKDGSIYKMWYCGRRLPVGTERIGYATSLDGINWIKYNDPSTTNTPYAESDPVLEVTVGEWDNFLVYHPCVILNNSTFEMWYAARGNGYPGENIGHATSSDGISWNKDTLNPVLTIGTSGQFDNQYVFAPSVILGNDQIYRMWYSGYGGSPNKRRIGYAATDSNAVPVELESFTAVTVGNNINLTWVTATELNNHGFELFRNGNKIAFVEGRGTTTEKQEYFYEDKNLKDGIYNYRLEQLDFDGTRSISSEVTVYLTVPKTFSLEQNYPNPFNPSTIISWQSPVSSWQTLKVYDLLGREVARLVDEFKPAGNYEVKFDASKLTSGVYVYKLKTENFISMKKMILLK